MINIIKPPPKEVPTTILISRANKNITKEILKYETEVNRFLRRFRAELPPKAVTTWKNKIETTNEDVNKLRESCRPDQELSQTEKKVERGMDKALLQK